jgi:hypothetical protein
MISDTGRVLLTDTAIHTILQARMQGVARDELMQFISDARPRSAPSNTSRR